MDVSSYRRAVDRQIYFETCVNQLIMVTGASREDAVSCVDRAITDGIDPEWLIQVAQRGGEIPGARSRWQP